MFIFFLENFLDISSFILYLAEKIFKLCGIVARQTNRKIREKFGIFVNYPKKKKLKQHVHYFLAKKKWQHKDEFTLFTAPLCELQT